MRTRQLAAFSGLFCLAVALLAMLFGSGLFAEPVAPLPPPAASAATSTEPAPAAPASGGDTIAQPGPEPAVAVAGIAKASTRIDTSGWTKGIIRGDIQLAVSVLPQLTSITVIVEEARQALQHQGEFKRPHKLHVPVKLGVGTPTFEVLDVPFSEHPYIVSCYAPGLNSSQRTCVIDAQHPLVDDVILAITPGAPFSVRVRDQDNVPIPKLDVRMEPIGEPGGRRVLGGTTDAFGTVVLESVLAGGYNLSLLKGGQYLLPQPAQVTVHPGTPGSGASVLGQSYTLQVPRGVPLRVAVYDSVGYGIAEASVTATPVDRIQGKPIELSTDYGGFAEFSHLQPGVWQITVAKDGYQRTDQQLTMRDGEAQVTRDFRLARLR